MSAINIHNCLKTSFVLKVPAILLTLVSTLGFTRSTSAWEPLWEVAHFPIHHIEVDGIHQEDEDTGLTEAVIRDTVELRIRANNIEIKPDEMWSLPHIDVTVRSMQATSPGGDIVVFYHLNFRVEKPQVVECMEGAVGVVSLMIKSMSYVGMDPIPDYPKSVLHMIEKMADQFSLEYLRAREQAPFDGADFAKQLTPGWECIEDSTSQP